MIVLAGDQQVTIDGVTRTAQEWAEASRLDLDLVRVRLHQGWPLARALTYRRLTRAQARMRWADVVRRILPSVGKVSAEFIPGRRKPRADRKQKRSSHAI